jgi:lambda repressor-like predicted transcriptional regulator
MPQRYRMPAGCDTELWSLVKPMRVEMRERGLSVAKLARDLGYDRSWVSRALSARQLPPQHLIMQIAETLGTDVAAAERRWRRTNARQHNARARIAGGGPPPGLHTYQDLRQALHELLKVRGISQRELTRRDPQLRRSTVGAVLRGERSTGQGMVIAIVRACDVSEQAEQAWADAWRRLGLPHRLEQRRRRTDGYKRKIRAERMSRQWT